jgi:hypothetical protein
VTGALIPPQSLDLSVYGIDRPQDLFFNTTLTDPVEPSLQVRLSLSVERNGNVIYQTDPNFLGTPITLNQFQQLQLDGSVLAEYLRPENLVGGNGSATGSVLLPEGFHQICLQVYGVDRNVPISNKFCVQANFQLNQPPQIIYPEFNAQMPYPELQNMTFTWSPMHLGSGNNPGPVEYEFELVQLPDGYFNTNDAFESALRIYSTTTMMPSLIYTQAEPLLQPNKVYAWRVRAYSSIHPTSRLFQNDGYSEISSFILYDGDPIENVIGGVNNPAPTGCSVFNTSYGPVTNETGEAISIVENDIVKLGYFNMQIRQASGGPAGYSGTGVVAFPMLNSKINVEFSGLRVNSDYRVFEAEEARALVDQPFELDRIDLQPANVTTALNSRYIDDLGTYFYSGIGQNRLTSGLNLADPNAQSLPIGLDQEGQPLVAVIGIDFSPSSAYLYLASWQDQERGEPLRFAATALAATPYGMKDGAHLVVLNDGGFSGNTEKITEAFEITYSGGADSRMYCDCKGYEELELEGKVQVAPGLMQEAGTGNPVVLNFKKNNQDAATYLGRLKPIPDFTIPTLPGFVFKPEKGSLDLQQEDRLKLDGTVTRNYAAPENTTWRGLVMEGVAVRLPEPMLLPGLDPSFVLTQGQLFVDDRQIAYGRFTENNPLALNNGKMGPWRYSIDQMELEIKEGETNGLTLSGKIQTPVFDDPFPYQGKLRENVNEQVVLDATIPKQKMGMSLWKAQFEHSDQSQVQATLLALNGKRSFAPQAEFTGALSIKLSDKEFNEYLLGNKAEIRIELLEALEIENLDFDLSAFHMDRFKVDPYQLPTERYSVDSLNVEQAKIQIGGLEDRLTDAEIIHKMEEGQAERLGLSLTVVHENNKVNFTFWSELEGNQFIFKGIEAKILELHCNCNAYKSVLPSKERWGMILDEVIKREYPHLFEETSGTRSGSLSDFEDQGQLVEWKKLFYAVLKEQLDETAVSGFPVIDDEKVVIPFLEKNLEVELKNNRYHGIFRDPIFSNDEVNWTNEVWEKLNEAQTGQDVRLPLLIDNSNWENFGFKANFNLPDYVRLFIADFRTAGRDNKLENAVLGLTLVAQISEEGESEEMKYIYFKLSDIPVGPDKVSFKDLYLQQVIDVQLNEQIKFLARPRELSKRPDGVSKDDFDAFKKNLSSLQKAYDANKTNQDKASFARLNCDEGFKLFNIQGLYSAKEETIIQREGLEYSTIPARFGFHLIGHNKKDENIFNHFIAPLKSTYRTDKGTEENWTFATIDAQHILFSAGDNFEAYLDYDADQMAEGPTTRDPKEPNDYAEAYDKQFKGLVFREIQFEIPDLEQRRESRTEEIRGKKTPISKAISISNTINSVYYDHATKMFQADYYEEKVVKEEYGARLGSWPYTLDTLSFNIQDNLLDDDALLIKGNLRIPVFTGDAPENDQLWSETYSRGWTSYSLNITYDRVFELISISGDLGAITDSLYHSAHIDGLGIRVDEGSSLEILYSESQKRFIARCHLNGRAIYQFTRPSITLPDLKFEGFKVNYESSGLCRSTSGTNGIETIDFGTWSLFPFSAIEKEALNKVANTGSRVGNSLKSGTKKVDKFTNKLKSLRKLQQSFIGIDINVHDPTFHCVGDEWYLLLGMDINIMRDLNNKDLKLSQKGKDRREDINTTQNRYSTEQEKRNAKPEDSQKYGNARKETIADAKIKQQALDDAEEKRNKSREKVKELRNKKKGLKKQQYDAHKAFVKLETEYNAAMKALPGARQKYNAAHKAWTQEKTDPQKIKDKDEAQRVKNEKEKLVKELKPAMGSKKEERDKYQKEVADVETELKQAIANAKKAESDLTIAKEENNKVFDQIAQENKSLKNQFKGQAKTAWETKTGAFSIAGSVKVIFDQDGFKTVEPSCFQVGGEVGPIKLSGGVNWLDDVAANMENYNPVESRWGESIIGMIEVTLLGKGLESKFQVGTKYHATDKDKDYTYWFADVALDFGDNSPIQYQGFSLNTVGGGFFYNMSKTTPKEERDFLKPAGNTDDCSVEGLEPGKSLSGLEYFPNEGGWGLYLKAGISHKARIAAEAVVSAEVENGDEFKELGVNLNGWMLYKEYSKKEEEAKGFLKSEFAFSAKGIEAIVGYKFIFEPQQDIKLLSPAGTTSGLTSNLTYQELARERKKDTPTKLDPNEWNIIHINLNWDKDQYYFHAGSWGIPPEMRNTGEAPPVGGPSSGLNMHTAGITLPMLGSVGIGAYLQAGNVLDDLAPIEYMLPGFDMEGIKLRTLKKPKVGVMAGMRFNANLASTFGPLRFRGDGTFGLNLQLAKFDGDDCGGALNEISYPAFFDRAYTQGNAYASLSASLDMHVNLYFVERDFNIFDAKAFLGLNFGFPNPTYLKGRFTGEFSVLDGKITGKFNMKINEGDLPCPDAEDNPLAGLKIHAGVNPENNKEPVNIFSIVQGYNNFSRDEVLDFPVFENPDEKQKVIGKDEYKYEVVKLEIKNNETGEIVKVSQDWNALGDEYSLTPEKTLSPNTNFTFTYTYKWKVRSVPDLGYENEEHFKGKSEWSDVEKDGDVYIETDDVKFRTGAFPETIVKEMLDYQTPGFRQRYWHKGYGKPMLKISDRVEIKDLADNLFPTDKDYTYLGRIYEYEDGKETNSYEIRITKVPGQEDLTIYKRKYKPVGDSKFKIPYLEEETKAVRTVEFPTLETLPFKKNTLYKLELIRGVEETVSKDSESKLYNDVGLEVTTETKSATFTTLQDVKVLYEYYFGTSQYENLAEKLKDTEIKYEPANQTRVDWASPDEPATLKADHQAGYVPPDDYYSFTTKTNEGFDQFDLDRIRKNARITFKDPYGKRFEFEKRMSDPDNPLNRIGEGFRLEPQETPGVTALNIYFERLNAFNKNHYYTEQDHMFLRARIKKFQNIDENILKTSVGTDWTYQFYNPHKKEEATGLISDAEMDAKDLRNPERPSSKQDPLTTEELFKEDISYDLLFENKYGRIVSNQLFSLGRIAQNYRNYIIYNRWINKYRNDKDINEEVVKTDLRKGQMTATKHHEKNTFLGCDWCSKDKDYSVKGSLDDSDEQKWHKDNLKYVEEGKWVDSKKFYYGLSKYEGAVPEEIANDPFVYKMPDIRNPDFGGYWSEDREYYYYKPNPFIGAYHGRITIQFPELYTWNTMNDIVALSDAEEIVNITLQPEREGKQVSKTEVQSEVQKVKEAIRLDFGDCMIKQYNSLFFLEVNSNCDWCLEQGRNYGEEEWMQFFFRKGRRFSNLRLQMVNKEENIYAIIFADHALTVKEDMTFEVDRSIRADDARVKENKDYHFKIEPSSIPGLYFIHHLGKDVYLKVPTGKVKDLKKPIFERADPSFDDADYLFEIFDRLDNEEYMRLEDTREDRDVLLSTHQLLTTNSGVVYPRDNKWLLRLDPKGLSISGEHTLTAREFTSKELWSHNNAERSWPNHYTFKFIKVENSDAVLIQNKFDGNCLCTNSRYEVKLKPCDPNDTYQQFKPIISEKETFSSGSRDLPTYQLINVHFENSNEEKPQALAYYPNSGLTLSGKRKVSDDERMNEWIINDQDDNNMLIEDLFVQDEWKPFKAKYRDRESYIRQYSIVASGESLVPAAKDPIDDPSNDGWKFLKSKNNDGFYLIKNQYQDLCLCATELSANIEEEFAGYQVALKPCNDADATQNWQIERQDLHGQDSWYREGMGFLLSNKSRYVDLKTDERYGLFGYNYKRFYNSEEKTGFILSTNSIMKTVLEQLEAGRFIINSINIHFDIDANPKSHLDGEN